MGVVGEGGGGMSCWSQPGVNYHGLINTIATDYPGLEIRGILVANAIGLAKMLPCFLICYRDFHIW